jgi:hypothetical protein
VFSASDINDTNGTLNLATGAQWAAGKNKIINGDFGVWQRGTSFTPTNGGFTSDRWQNYFDGSGTRTYSQQSFTLGTAPVAGYESSFFIRLNQSVAGTGGTFNEFNQSIENVRTFAGQTVTLSFWAKAATSTTLPSIVLRQAFGSGGSPSSPVNTTVASSILLTTNWTRYSYTVTLPSIAGKTLGSNANTHYLQLINNLPLNSTFTVDIWGVQLEQGSTATAFQTATGTIQGELAACQRYYFRSNAGSAYAPLSGTKGAFSTTLAQIPVYFPVQMRVKPTSVDYANIIFSDGGGAITPSSVVLGAVSPLLGAADGTATGLTQFRPYTFVDAGSSTGYIGFSAEF